MSAWGEAACVRLHAVNSLLSHLAVCRPGELCQRWRIVASPKALTPSHLHTLICLATLALCRSGL